MSRALAIARGAASGIAALAIASCSSSPFALRQSQGDTHYSYGSGSNVLQHVVIVIQENRTFDNFFSTFPGADGATQGRMKTPSGYTYVALHPAPLNEKCDFGHSYSGFLKEYDGGKMDGFNLEGGGKPCPGPSGTHIYQYVEPTQIEPYWEIAKTYVLADHMFQTQGSGSFTAHQDLIAGGTIINPARTKSLIDFPSHVPWGCDAQRSTRTSYVEAKGSKLRYRRHQGPFPCLTYPTLRDLLDAREVSWKYYSPPEPSGTGEYWSAFDAIKAVRERREWRTNVVDTSRFFDDATKGKLPAISWIVPDNPNSDHPGNGSDTGPSWVASIVNAIGESSQWSTSAVIVVWDDWGGFYDHEPPPFFDQWGGLGFRVPMLVVSPYAREAYPSKPGYISHTQYEFGSILKFVEDVWGLGSLGSTDERATSIVDCFDFTQPPRSFTPIQAKYSRAYFEAEPPSYRPVDTQ